MIHFYHIFCFGDYWEKIVISHFNLLRINKLIFEKVYIGLVGDQRERAKEILTNLNIANLVIVNEKEFGWEQETLSYLDQNRKIFLNKIIFYAHSKGASKQKLKPWSDVVLWRKSMEFHNIVKWREAVTLLEFYDSYGCHFLKCFRMEYDFHYAGHYWWITGDALQRLGELRNDTRFDAEDWIGSMERAFPYAVSTRKPNYSNFTNVPMAYSFIIFCKNIYNFLIRKTHKSKKKNNKNNKISLFKKK